ncbi:hypothetical protein [Streptomyces olivoreticuli]|uniref:hypothetical protein n=1 Tax=Streptomyces olivoreticuli TaxID=68246 RepID=UPI0013C372F9|nr:hypothetical protein [Streptomyces olivoreticuli]
MDEKTRKLDYEPETRSSQAVEKEIGSLSSKVLDMLQVKGKVTEPGPAAGSCSTSDGDVSGYRSVRHPWSLYGADNDSLQKGMNNLKDKLPAQGWKVERYGADTSRNQNLEISAVHSETRTQLEVTWMKGLDGKEPLIEVTLYSRCFRDSGDPNTPDSN